MNGHRPLVIAHRGGSPLDIDNSHAAFSHALQVGADMLECDVRRTGDGELVLIHDPVVGVEGQRLVIHDTSFRVLKRHLDWLITLDDFLEAYGQAAPFNLDMKTHGYELETLAALRRHALVDKALVSTVHSYSIYRLSRVEPRLELGLSRGHLNSSVSARSVTFWLQVLLPALLPLMLRIAGARATMLQYRVVTPNLVRHLHRKGHRVFVWTVDDGQDARRMSALGVDGMATNLLTEILGALDRPRD